MADRIAVMKDGVLQAFEEPQELHDRPKNRFIAEFIGNPPINTLDVDLVRAQSNGAGKVLARSEHFEFEVPAQRLPKKPTGSAVLGVRPQHVSLTKSDTSQAIVELIEPLGRDDLVMCRLGEHTINVLADPGLDLAIGDAVELSFQMREAQLFDSETGKSLLWS